MRASTIGNLGPNAVRARWMCGLSGERVRRCRIMHLKHAVLLTRAAASWLLAIALLGVLAPRAWALMYNTNTYGLSWDYPCGWVDPDGCPGDCAEGSDDPLGEEIGRAHV